MELSNGNHRLTLIDLAKIAGVVISSIALVFLGANFLGMSPESTRSQENRLTNIEASTESILSTLETLTNDMKITSAMAIVERSDLDKRLSIIENISRFTTQDGVQFQRDLTELRMKIATLPPELWRQRIEYIEKFLTRHYPTEFQK